MLLQRWNQTDKRCYLSFVTTMTKTVAAATNQASSQSVVAAAGEHQKQRRQPYFAHKTSPLVPKPLKPYQASFKPFQRPFPSSKIFQILNTRLIQVCKSLFQWKVQNFHFSTFNIYFLFHPFLSHNQVLKCLNKTNGRFGNKIHPLTTQFYPWLL